jgi:AraC-like DNA-binding protein
MGAPARDPGRWEDSNSVTMGVQAGERCDDFGWKPYGLVDPSLVADTTQHARYGAGRAWSNSATYTLTQAPNRIYLVYTVEGGFDFTVDGVGAVAEAGQLILLDGEAPTAAQTLAGTARFVWFFEPTLLDPRKSRFRFHDPISVNNAAIGALVSTTNSILNTTAPRNPASQRHLGVALEHLVAGALAEAGSTLPGSSHSDGLFMAAQLAIETGFRDPDFDVTQLAKELSVSVRGVHAVFSRFGTTPRKEIERRRVSEVDRLAGEVLTAAQVIELTGFTSLRQMNRALARSSAAFRALEGPLGEVDGPYARY